MRAVIYARVSDDRQGGRSVREQIAECTAVVFRDGDELVGTYIDNDRGASRHSRASRPDWDRLLADLAAGIAEKLVVWEASRSQRDMEVYLRLRAICQTRGVLYSYSGRTYDLDRADDSFATALDALLAEREAGITRERVLRAVRAQAAAGRPHGRLTYGYRRTYESLTGMLVGQEQDPGRGPIVTEVFARYGAGETAYSIAQDLTARNVSIPYCQPVDQRRGGLAGKRVVPAGECRHCRATGQEPCGAAWLPETVTKILRNPAYIAKRVHRGKVIGDASWPPLTDDATFYVAQARLRRQSASNTRDASVKHLLSGILRCGVCGKGLRVLKNRGIPSYVCHPAAHVAVKQENVDKFVVDQVVHALTTDQALLRALQAQDTTSRVFVRLEELRAELDDAYRLLSVRGIAEAEKRLLPAIAAAEEEARRNERLPALVLDLFQTKDEEERLQVWNRQSIHLQRATINALARWYLAPGRRGERRFDGSRVSIYPRFSTTEDGSDDWSGPAQDLSLILRSQGQ